ncbi:hypothetical protein G6F35_000323 [Rhizopus arrhizus]|nr:hypothetical protein G6F35_000323 [Rhizopus arrhizus]
MVSDSNPWSHGASRPNLAPVPMSPDRSPASSVLLSFSNGGAPGSPSGPPSVLSKDAQSLPDDDTLLGMFQFLKTTATEMLTYLHGGRDERILEIQRLNQRIQNVAITLPMIPPESQEELSLIIMEKRNMVETLQAQITELDGNIVPAREFIKEHFGWYLQHVNSTLQTYIKDFQWPTLGVCQELELPQEVVQMVLNPWKQDVKPTGGEQDIKDQTIAELRNMIKELQNERLLWRQGKEKTAGINGGEKTKEESTEYVRGEKYRERRRRIRIPTFEKGSAESAQKWIYRYESISTYLGFNEQEMVEELCAVLEGQALNWFNSLRMETKKNWIDVKTQFLHQYGGGANPALAALDELKNLRQGKMAIGEFAPKLMDLLYRAQVYTPAIQLDYFKEKIRPELKTAVIFGRATDLDTGIEIATEVEREFSRRGPPTYGYGRSMAIDQAIPTPVTYDESSSGSNTSNGSGEQQNFQNKGSSSDTRKCYYCNKPGHMKKDCRKRTNNSKNSNKFNNSSRFNNNNKSNRFNSKNSRFKNNNQEAEIVNQYNNNEDDDDIDIFSHFLQNNQNDLDINLEINKPNRFHIIVKHEQQQQQTVLVDTGSTISTISAVTAKNLNLPQYKCNAATIKYGNTTTQQSSAKAVFKFNLDEQTESTAFVYIVEKQNEDIILGMDWMINEDIILHPRTKTVKKSVQTNNDMSVTNLITSKFPNLVKESEHQSITNAPYAHRIDTGDALPVAQRDYRRSHSENAEIAKEVKKMLASKVITPSTSDWCSPVVLITKPDGGKRFCVDYRGLNKVTIKDKYPLPRISELLDRLQGSKYFSGIDLKSGYWQLPLDPKDAKKTAFIANGSLYQFTCLPFGVVNGPSSFMRFMHGILRGLPRIMVYLDDIIVYSSSKEQHQQDLRNVLQRLNDYNLKISIKKCQFFQKEIKFLGFLVSGHGIRSDPSKVEVIKTWPTPSSVKQVQRFLGFCAFYHRFIANLSTMAKPLYKLLKKEERVFKWTPAAQEAFEQLKSRMVELPTLAYPNPEEPYDLHCDASDSGLGAILVQIGRPIAFASRTLTDPEQNYSTTEKECLAIVWALNYFYPYLFGAQFTIYTDHAALKSILSTKMPRGRIARWILTIQSYQFTIIHKKGSLNADADALSRLSSNNQDLAELTLQGFHKLQQEDKVIALLKREVKTPYVWKNGLLCYQLRQDKLVPILPRIMVSKVLEKYHNGLTGGHFGVDKTMEKIKEVAWWPGIAEDVKTYIKSCPQCQRYKIRTDSAVAPLKPILPRYTGDCRIPTYFKHYSYSIYKKSE